MRQAVDLKSIQGTFNSIAERDGFINISFSLNAVRDNAGNGNARAEVGRIDIDTIIPTVSVSGFPPATPERNGFYDLTVMFSEKVYGFMVPDGLTLGLVAEPGSETPIATAALMAGEDGDAVYTVRITPNAAGAEGDVTVTVNAGAAQDLALNDNIASAVTPPIHIDTNRSDSSDFGCAADGVGAERSLRPDGDVLGTCERFFGH